ncbi:MAG: hypothetical protein V5A34_06390 [Halapricum sp.]
MSDDRPESGRARFLEALEVRKNAVRGFGFGVLATIIVYVLFVVLPGKGGLRASVWYLGLGVSLALALGGLVTTVLVALRARRLAKEI